MGKGLRSIVGAILLLACSQNAIAGEIGSDKGLHFGFSAFMGFTTDVIMFTSIPDGGSWERVATSTAIASIPGAIKELGVDSKFDALDMTANVLGAFTGAVASELLNAHIGVAVSGKQWFVNATSTF